MKVSKSYIIIYLICVFSASYLINGCAEDETITNPPPSGGAFTLSGSVTNYPGGSVIAKAEIIKSFPPDTFAVGTDTIDNDAQLNMSLVTPPSDFLIAIYLIVPSGISVSDTSAKITTFGGLRAYTFSGALLGYILKKNFADTVFEGSFAVQYIFSTKAVTVTGSDTTINITDTTISAYNLSMQAGWNTISIRRTVQRPNFQLTDFLSGELAGASWRWETAPLFRKFKGFVL